MLQGRKLAHLYGRRLDSLNRHEWFTYHQAGPQPCGGFVVPWRPPWRPSPEKTGPAVP